MATAFLVSTALMGVIGALMLAWIGRRRGWYEYSPSTAIVPAERAEAVRQTDLSDDPRALALGFAVLVVAAVGGVVAYISGPVEQQATIGAGVALGAGAILAGYLLYGVYLSAVTRGHPRSLAVAESATVAGALFLVAVTAQLLA